MNGPDISNWSMIVQLGAATIMMMLTTFIHGAGLFGISRTLGIERNLETQLCVDLVTTRGLFITVGLVLTIFVLHMVEISLYAALYYGVGAFSTLARAVYFSTITYGTIGYDNNDLPGRFQLIAAIEGINGIILLGWSTAFIVTTISRISRHGG